MAYANVPPSQIRDKLLEGREADRGQVCKPKRNMDGAAQLIWTSMSTIDNSKLQPTLWAELEPGWREMWSGIKFNIQLYNNNDGNNNTNVG